MTSKNSASCEYPFELWASEYKRAFWVLSAYAFILMIGGLMGFALKGSIYSLIGGASASVAIAACFGTLVVQRWRGKYALFAKRAAVSIASLLIGFFCYRLLLTGALMPALPIIAFSLLVVGMMVTLKLRS